MTLPLYLAFKHLHSLSLAYKQFLHSLSLAYKHLHSLSLAYKQFLHSLSLAYKHLHSLSLAYKQFLHSISSIQTVLAHSVSSIQTLAHIYRPIFGFNYLRSSLPLPPPLLPSPGTYTNSQGIALVREHVADFITRRDATVAPSNPNHIFLLNGASDGIKSMIFTCVNQAESCGVMIPIPQYPIYTASIAEFGAKKVSSR